MALPLYPLSVPEEKDISFQNELKVRYSVRTHLFLSAKCVSVSCRDSPSGSKEKSSSFVGALLYDDDKTRNDLIVELLAVAISFCLH